MALGTLGALGLIGVAGPPVLRGISSGLRWLRSKWDPVGFKKQETLKSLNITPEQYDIRRRNLQEGLAAIKTPTQIFSPMSPAVRQQQDITAGLPTTIGGGVRPARPTGLSALLGSLATSARSGYEEDLARIGARPRAVRNPVGRTSGELGMRQEALRGRSIGYAKGAMGLLSDYATRNAIAELEAQNTGLQRDESQQALQNFLSGLRQRQQSGMQQDYLGQQRYNLAASQLSNLSAQERYQQGLRRYQIGMQTPYNIQQQRMRGV